MRRIMLVVVVAAALMLALPLSTLAADPTAVVQAPKGLNLRQAPGLDATIIFGLSNGETVTVLDGLAAPIYANGVRWVKVGVWRWGYWYTGYVSFAYLDLYGAYGGYHEPVGQWGGANGLKVTAGALNLRYGPALTYGIGRVVPYGTVLEGTGAATVSAGGYTWQQVTTGGGLWAANTFLTAVP